MCIRNNCALTQITYKSIFKRCFSCSMIFMTFLFCAELSADEFTAESIYRKMTAVYSGLNFYEVNGVRNSIYYNKKNEFDSQESQLFEVSYVRSKKFSFEWIDYVNLPHQRRTYLKSEKDGVLLKIGSRDAEMYDDFSAAISSIAGVTGRVSTWVPKYFLEGVSCPDISKLGLSLIGVELLSGREMYRLKVVYLSGVSEHIWIDKELYVLKKRSSKFEGPNFNIVSEVVYHTVEFN